MPTPSHAFERDGGSEMPPREFVTGAGFKITLESLRLRKGGECTIEINQPWREFGGMLTFAGIMITKALL